MRELCCPPRLPRPVEEVAGRRHAHLQERSERQRTGAAASAYQVVRWPTTQQLADQRRLARAWPSNEEGRTHAGVDEPDDPQQLAFAPESTELHHHGAACPKPREKASAAG